MTVLYKIEKKACLRRRRLHLPDHDAVSSYNLQRAVRGHIGNPVQPSSLSFVVVSIMRALSSGSGPPQHVVQLCAFFVCILSGTFFLCSFLCIDFTFQLCYVFQPSFLAVVVSALSRLQLWFVFCPPQPLHRPVGLFGHDLNPSSCMLLAGVWQQHAAVSASAADLR